MKEDPSTLTEGVKAGHMTSAQGLQLRHHLLGDPNAEDMIVSEDAESSYYDELKNCGPKKVTAVDCDYSHLNYD